MRKLLLVLLVLGAAAGIVLVSVESGDLRPRVTVETVSARDFVATVDASGVVRPEESVEISAEVVGRILEIRVRPGDPVAPGQVVALIDDATQRTVVEEQRAVVREHETALADTEVALADAERERRRAAELHSEGVVSARQVEEKQVALDRARIAMARAEQGIERARSALRRAEEDLQKTVVRSPIRGIVLEVQLEEGELVVASSQNLPGSKIMTLGTETNLYVEADIPEIDVVSVQLGQPVEVTLPALSGVTLAGEVIEIQRVGQRSESRTFGGAPLGAEFQARVGLGDPPALVRPSMSAQVRIETDRHPEALSVPIGALLRRYPEGSEPTRRISLTVRAGAGTEASAGAPSQNNDDRAEDDGSPASWQVVFVVEDGRVAERRVETGLSDLLSVEVISGLDAGDRIVVGPPSVTRALGDGDEVLVAGAENFAEPD